MALRYIAEAPLGAITETYRKLAAGRSISGQLDALFTEVYDLRCRLDHMKTAVVSDIASERALVSSQTEFTEVTSASRYLVSLVSGRIHSPFTDRAGTTIERKAKCGWCYKGHECNITHSLPRMVPTLICGVCLPRHRRACRSTPAGSLVESSSSSDS